MDQTEKAVDQENGVDEENGFDEPIMDYEETTNDVEVTAITESNASQKTLSQIPTHDELYHLIRDAVAGKADIDKLASKLNDCIKTSESIESFIESIFDTLVQLDVETSIACDNGSKERRDAFILITKTFLKSDILSTQTALERFDIETLCSLGLVNDKRVWTTIYNRLRTRLYFKQKKFNLLREENDGFARVLTELFRLSIDNIAQVHNTIIELVGKYSIDPNRILDLALEIFEFQGSRNQHNVFVEFLKLYYNKNMIKITELIVLKLKFYTNYMLSDQIVIPQSFYRLLAILIDSDIIDLEDIYPCFTPSDVKILEYHQKLVEESRIFSRQYAMAKTTSDGDGNKPQPKTVLESLSDEDRHNLEIDNQKVNLCSHLIDIGSWDKALQIVRKLPEYYCFGHKRVALSACDLIDYLIDPIYRECAFSSKILNSRIRPISNRNICLDQVKTIDEFKTQIFPMITVMGPFISADTLLLTKLIRVLRYILLRKDSETEQDLITSEKSPYHEILDIVNDSILPAISLSGGNSCLARELWTLLKNFKYHTRYRLYCNWRYEGSNPVMLRNKGHILLRAKHQMKRLSKELLRLTGRHIGKICYSNPVISLDYLLIQIQSYDNLINFAIDALRFLPPLGMDVLVYCILEALSNSNKNKKSSDGMALAQWLTSLSSFSANVILRYKVEFTSFLEYIANQLKAGNSLDLVLLTDLIQKMTGIETMQAITDDRIEALMGGEVLRTEGAYFNQVKNTRKPSARLKDALIESRLAMELCLLMAQTRDSLFFNNQDDAPLKLIGKLYDQCQETLVQYEVFLSMNLSIDDYINFLPPLEKLMTDYKLDPDSAFFLARPMIFHKIKSKFLELKTAAAKQMTIEEGESPELSLQSLGIKFVEATRSVINPIAKTVQPFLTEKYGTNNLNAKLFVIFWTLSMSDIEVPMNCYDREIQRLKSALADLGKSTDDDPKRRKERERCNSLIQKLKQEQNEQTEHVSYIRMYLESEKNNLFCERSGFDHVYLESRQFVQHCPYARSTLTAHDAVYSARFLLYLHELKVEDYSTIICLDRLLCDLTYMIGACTENEATHYGRFLNNILKTTSHWHSSAEIYNEQCEQYPGSIINIENSSHISYEGYRDICYKWHYRMTRAFTVALKSNNYIQIRNALIVMISIIEYYPAIRHFGKGIGLEIDEVRNNEKDARQDLYALATGYACRLDEKKPLLIPESNFHTVDNNHTAKSSSSGSRPSSKTSSHQQRERHSSSSSRKRARHS